MSMGDTGHTDQFGYPLPDEPDQHAPTWLQDNVDAMSLEDQITAARLGRTKKGVMVSRAARQSWRLCG